MRRLSEITLTLVLLTIALPALTARAETFHWQSEATAVLRVEIFKGDIVVRPSSGTRIEVSAVKRGGEAQAREVKIEVEEKASEVTIRAVYPRRKDRNEPQSKVEIDFEISLPAGVRFIGRTEVGDIEALRLSDPVEAFSAVGDIRISTAAYAEARTTIGSIVASLGGADWKDTLSFSTVNGDIEVEIPGSANVEVSAVSTNGRFDTDLFPLERNRYGIPGTRIRGKLGSGGRKLELESVNGDLELRRRSR